MSRYRVSVMVGKAARLDHLYEPQHDVYARMGHYWWFWIPFHHGNGGSMKRGDTCIDHSFKWLCFWVSVTFWKKPTRNVIAEIRLEKSKQQAFDALERLSRAGHGPTFSQQAVWLGQDKAMGYGKTSEDFAVAILALEKTGGVK